MLPVAGLHPPGATDQVLNRALPPMARGSAHSMTAMQHGEK